MTERMAVRKPITLGVGPESAYKFAVRVRERGYSSSGIRPALCKEVYTLTYVQVVLAIKSNVVGEARTAAKKTGEEQRTDYIVDSSRGGSWLQFVFFLLRQHFSGRTRATVEVSTFRLEIFLNDWAP